MKSRTFDANDETLDFTMPTGGVFVFDAYRIAGDATFTLQISRDGGTNFVNYYDRAGSLVQASCSSSQPHCRFEEIARKDTVFRVISSATASSPNYLGEADRAVATF